MNPGSRRRLGVARPALLPFLAVAFLALGAPRDLGAVPPAPDLVGCSTLDGGDALDFWVGRWSVRVGGQEVGTNRIEKILEGCAVEEHWLDWAGREGRSLFYFVPALTEWRQVWVTAAADQPGGVKEKRLVERTHDGAVRFQGEIHLAGGSTYLDRTTLTPLKGGSVRQLIEVSTDGGATWRPTFDAEYVAVSNGPAEEAGRDAQHAAVVSAGTREMELGGGLTVRMLVEEAMLPEGGVEVAEITFPAGMSPRASHAHGASEILYVVEGELGHVVNGIEHRLLPGMAGVVPAGQPVIHRVHSEEAVRALVIWVPGGEADRIAPPDRWRVLRR